MSSLKEIIVKVYAKYVVKETLKWSNNPIQTQEKVMKMLVSKAKNTKFGKDAQSQMAAGGEKRRHQARISCSAAVTPGEAPGARSFMAAYQR